MDEILADYNEAELELLAGFLQKARQISNLLEFLEIFLEPRLIY